MKGYPDLLMTNLWENDKIETIWGICKAMFEKGRSLDMVHARISLDYGLRLLGLLGGHPEIVIPAILLHDIGNTMIPGEDLEKKTINPGTEASEKTYSTTLKKKHLIEGESLSRKILEAVRYPSELVGPVAEIVGDHESPWGGPPGDKENHDKVIVSDADKLYRYSANGFFSMCKIHDIPEEDMLRLNLRKMEEWLITDAAKVIALEEMRKMSGSHLFDELMKM